MIISEDAHVMCINVELMLIQLKIVTLQQYVDLNFYKLLEVIEISNLTRKKL